MPTWSTPPTFTDGVLTTASDLNKLRDNLLALRSAATCRVSSDTAQSIPSGTWTPVAMPIEEYDPLGWHSGASAEVIPKVAGLYMVMASVEFANNGTGVRGARIALNSATAVDAVADQVLVNAVQSFATHLSVASVVRCNGSSDRIMVAAYQNSGGALPAASGSALTLHHSLTVTWIGA